MDFFSPYDSLFPPGISRRGSLAESCSLVRQITPKFFQIFLVFLLGRLLAIFHFLASALRQEGARVRFSSPLEPQAFFFVP